MQNSHRRVEITRPDLEFGIMLQNQACIIPISVGQKYHEPAVFEETLNHLAAQNYGEYVIVVADTLQHYTLRMRKSFLKEDQAKQKALERGTEWLDQAKPVIERTFAGKKNYRIVRWEECLQDPLCPAAMQEIFQRYENEPEFKASIEKIVETYLDGFENKGKKQRKGSATNSDLLEKTTEQLRKEKLCRNYILEETALIMVWQNRACNLTWKLPNAQRFFLAYSFGGHSSNEAIYNHLTQLRRENSYELINIKICEKPREHKTVSQDSISYEDQKKLDLVLSSVIMTLKISNLSPELQLALLTRLTQEVNANAQASVDYDSHFVTINNASSTPPLEDKKLTTNSAASIEIKAHSRKDAETAPCSQTSSLASNSSWSWCDHSGTFFGCDKPSSPLTPFFDKQRHAHEAGEHKLDSKLEQGEQVNAL